MKRRNLKKSQEEYSVICLYLIFHKSLALDEFKLAGMLVIFFHSSFSPINGVFKEIVMLSIYLNHLSVHSIDADI